MCQIYIYILTRQRGLCLSPKSSFDTSKLQRRKGGTADKPGGGAVGVAVPWGPRVDAPTLHSRQSPRLRKLPLGSLDKWLPFIFLIACPSVSSLWWRQPLGGRTLSSAWSAVPTHLEEWNTLSSLPHGAKDNTQIKDEKTPRSSTTHHSESRATKMINLKSQELGRLPQHYTETCFHREK